MRLPETVELVFSNIVRDMSKSIIVSILKLLFFFFYTSIILFFFTLTIMGKAHLTKLIILLHLNVYLFAFLAEFIALSGSPRNLGRMLS